jgi:hypothetical protein
MQYPRLFLDALGKVVGDEYTVRAVAEWTMPGASREFTHLTVEELPSP